MRPKAGWKDDAQNGMRKMGIVTLRKVVHVRDGRRTTAREALVLRG